MSRGVEKKLGPRMAAIVAKGRIPFATVDFPRYDIDGNATESVYLRPLTQVEQDNARANALEYVARCLGGKSKPDWKPEELEDNAVAAEILAIACRDPDDPEKPFFPFGVMELRECTTDELAMLFRAYNAVREKAYPSLREMTEEDLWAWTHALQEDVENNHPLLRTSRPKLEAYCVWAARSLASLLTQSSGMRPSSSAPSPPSEPDASSTHT